MLPKSTTQDCIRRLSLLFYFACVIAVPLKADDATPAPKPPATQPEIQSGLEDPDQTPPAETTTLRIDLQASLGGARYKPASPAQRATVRQATPRIDSPAGLDSYQTIEADAYNPREPVSRTDQSQALGVIFSASGGQKLFYELNAGLFIQQGEYRFRRVDSSSGRAEPAQTVRPDTVVVLPGEQLRLGLRFCETRCEFSLGRIAPGNEDDPIARPIVNQLTGGHGAITGVHLNFVHPGYGEIHIAPLYRPELSGSYLPENSKSFTGHEPVLNNSPRRLRSDFSHVAQKSRSYGHRVDYTGSFGSFRLGMDYAIHRQADTANPAAGDSSSDSSNSLFRRSVDHIQYTGVGLAITGETYYLIVHLQRSAGAYRTLLARPTANATETTTANTETEPTIDRNARIAGSALRTSAGIRWQGFHLRLNFFLPEPEPDRAPGEPAGTTGSGYIGFGDSPLQSPILAGVLDFRPTPELCHERGLCEGLAIRNFATDAPPGTTDTDVDPFETGFRDHAAVFTFRAQYSFPDFTPGLALTILAPLAPGGRGGHTPFQRIKKDPHSFEYRELELYGRWDFPGDGHVFFRYSRLYRRHPAVGSLLAGESLWFALQYEF